MNKTLLKIFETKTFLNSSDQVVEIHSETSKLQCELLQRIIKDNNFKKSLEIGFAFGISTLAIIEQIVQNNGKHVVIDKFELNNWGGNGLDLINQTGYSTQLEFIEEFCYVALPKLLEEGRTFDFAYIDSTKQMDWLLVNFFYIDKLLDINGIVCFDDVHFPSIRKLLRYISQFPNYEIYSQFPSNVDYQTKIGLSKLLRRSSRSRIYLKEEFLISDFELGINCNCIALIKTGEDNRSWDWHVKF